jgi:hypothetical protein
MDSLLKALSGTSNELVLGTFKALLTAVAAPLLLFIVKSWHSEFVKRRDRRRELYADALSTCMEYEEFPFVIYRRNGKKPEDERLRISEALRDVQKHIAYHQSWLRTESMSVADKYDELVSTLRSVAGEEMKKRWKAAPIKKDADMIVAPKFDWSAITAKEASYLKAVRKQLAPLWKRPFIR